MVTWNLKRESISPSVPVTGSRCLGGVVCWFGLLLEDNNQRPAPDPPFHCEREDEAGAVGRFSQTKEPTLELQQPHTTLNPKP